MDGLVAGLGERRKHAALKEKRAGGNGLRRELDVEAELLTWTGSWGCGCAELPA